MAKSFMKIVDYQYERVIKMIMVNLDVMLAKRKMTLTELSEEVGISLNNLSILKTNKARSIRFTTLNSICKVLNCQPGDILEYIDDGEN